ncbi:brachyurin-like isoform X2 [Daphnia carinata]|uniref:brachyurin-like isoform X2 n=1 Tax=Daphnia carinata TaxID=120202 RepID=UPI00257BD7BE|nr:brachyurin-like isoform X2 [Daphnia carinata]
MLELDKFAYRVLVILLSYLCYAVICLEPAEIDAYPLSSLVHSSTNSIQLSSRITKSIRRDLTSNFRDIIVKSNNDNNYVCGLANQPSNNNYSNNGPWTKIVGGVETAPHEFPWQVFLVLHKTNDESFACGGSLISDRWILTAAHCLINTNLIHITLGAHDLEDEGEVHQERYTSREYLIHPDWDSETLHADIALVRLPATISFSKYIQPVCLDSPSDPAVDYVNDTVLLTGWGLTSDESGGVSSVLRKTMVKVITNEKCLEQYDSVITDEMICTSGEDHQGSCHGDSGGPMNFRQADGTWKQIGIVSFGSNQGCESGYANGFTRVSSFSSWIKNTIIQREAANRSTSILAPKQPLVMVLLLLLALLFEEVNLN